MLIITILSIHAPREGGDRTPTASSSSGSFFQSTPPVRGATALDQRPGTKTNLSIHAPREGGDCRAHLSRWCGQYFQSTPPVRGATCAGGSVIDFVIFQSTPPVRGATIDNNSNNTITGFQSTPPVRGATSRGAWESVPGCDLSIHAPREGGDPSRWMKSSEVQNLSIHAPREGGDFHFFVPLFKCGLSIHAPREGGDKVLSATMYPPKAFNPRPP